MKTRKLIIAGGRNFNDYEVFKAVLDQYIKDYKDTYEIEIVSGMARGADLLAYQYAKQNNLVCHEFPANWNKYSKAAGFIRNKQMSGFADALLAFWDGHSKGTANMISLMTKLHKPVEVHEY